MSAVVGLYRRWWQPVHELARFGIDVASASAWASLQVTRRNPSAAWTSALARTVAADLAARGRRLERVMTDNAQEFRSVTFQQAISQLGARHSFIRAGRPQTNGCVERVQQTILDECWKPAFARYLVLKQTGLRLDLERHLGYDNTERAHTGRWTRGRSPEAVSGRPSSGTRTADASSQLDSGTGHSKRPGTLSAPHALTAELAGLRGRWLAA
jgi:hypothetical protein